jgi:hypothetical protein
MVPSACASQGGAHVRAHHRDGRVNPVTLSARRGCLGLVRGEVRTGQGGRRCARGRRGLRRRGNGGRRVRPAAARRAGGSGRRPAHRAEPGARPAFHGPVRLDVDVDGTPTQVRTFFGSEESDLLDAAADWMANRLNALTDPLGFVNLSEDASPASELRLTVAVGRSYYRPGRQE